MNVLDYLDSESIILDVKAKNKKAAISLMLDHLVNKKKITKKDKPAIVRAIFRREEMGSTAIGNRIAFPHARVGSVKDIIICLAISKEGIDFDSLDQEPVNIIALLLSNQSEAGLHLKMLAFLARMLRDKYLVQRLRNAKEQSEVIAFLRQQQQAIG